MADTAAGPAARHVPAWRQYRTLLGAAFRAQLQYRGNLLLSLLGGLAYQGVGLAFVWVVVERFGRLGGWSMGEIAFLYGMRLTSHAIWTVPFSQLLGIDFALQRGEFDRFLIRPAGVLSQFLTRGASVQPLGDLVGGVGVLVAASAGAPVDWSPLAVLYLLAALLGGALVEVAVQLLISAFSFRLLSTRALRIQVDNVMNNFGGYPQAIFPTAVKFVLTFVIPLAFVAYLPANVLLDRAGGLGVAPWLAACAPVVGPLLFLAAYRVWYAQLKHYKSTGT